MRRFVTASLIALACLPADGRNADAGRLRRSASCPPSLPPAGCPSPCQPATSAAAPPACPAAAEVAAGPASCRRIPGCPSDRCSAFSCAYPAFTPMPGYRARWRFVNDCDFDVDMWIVRDTYVDGSRVSQRGDGYPIRIPARSTYGVQFELPYPSRANGNNGVILNACHTERAR